VGALRASRDLSNFLHIGEPNLPVNPRFEVSWTRDDSVLTYVVFYQADNKEGNRSTIAVFWHASCSLLAPDRVLGVVVSLWFSHFSVQFHAIFRRAWWCL